MQPWPGEVLEERAPEIATAFAALLTRQAGWRHRRVETITVLSHEQARRAVSVDLTVPVEHRDELLLDTDQWIVPLALLAKRKLVHFDLRDEDEAVVPLLRSDEAQMIARELLYLALDLDLEDAEPGFDAGALIERVLAAGPQEADAVAAAVAEVGARAPGFAALAEQLAHGFLLCAVLRDVSRRRVIKFAYDERFDRLGLVWHLYDAPGSTEAASYHVEVDVPDELRARSTNMIDATSGEVLAAGPLDADRPALHFVAAIGARVQPALSVRYGTERGRFLAPAALVAWVIALELALPWLFADLRALATSGGPAIAVLLSSSALFSGLVLRSGEHPLVVVVLARYRLCLAAATVSAVAAGAVLAFHASSATLNLTWGVGALVALLAAGILSIEAALAPASARNL